MELSPAAMEAVSQAFDKQLKETRRVWSIQLEQFRNKCEEHFKSSDKPKRKRERSASTSKIPKPGELHKSDFNKDRKPATSRVKEKAKNDFKTKSRTSTSHTSSKSEINKVYELDMSTFKRDFEEALARIKSTSLLKERANVANSLYINPSESSELYEPEMDTFLFDCQDSFVSTNPSQELPSVMSEILQENRGISHSEFNELYDPEMTAFRFDYDEPLAGIKQAEEVPHEMIKATGEYKADLPTDVPPASLTEANKEDVGSKGVEAQEKPFTAIQEKLTSVPTLLLSDFDSTFGNECDASKVGIDAVLMQDKRPIAYLSEILGGAALVCPTCDKELNASDQVFKAWQHYLWFQEFAIHTGLRYKKGMGNVVADALSRRYPLVSTLSSRLLGFEEIVELYETNDDSAESYGKCHKFAFESYHRQDGYLFHMDRVCIPRGSTRELVARKAHGGGPAGHVRGNITPWKECLLHFESAYSHAKLSATPFSAFEFDYGFHHQFPLDLISLPLSVKCSFAGQERGEQVRKMQAKAKENMWIYLRQDRTPGEKKDKLLLRADDLVDANKKINSNDYQIDPPGRYEKSPTINVSNLLPCYAGSDLRTNPLEEGEDDTSMASQEIEAEAAPEIDVAELAEEAHVLNGEGVFNLPRSHV